MVPTKLVVAVNVAPKVSVINTVLPGGTVASSGREDCAVLMNVNGGLSSWVTGCALACPAKAINATLTQTNATAIHNAFEFFMVFHLVKMGEVAARYPKAGVALDRGYLKLMDLTDDKTIDVVLSIVRGG